MNKKIFAVTSDQFNLGTTFVIWSIHHLNGQTKFFSLENNQISVIPSDPLLRGTAHHMEPNEIKSIADIEETMTQMIAHDGLNHFRFVPKEPSLDLYFLQSNKFQKKMNERSIKVINVGCKKLQALIGFLRYNKADLTWQNDIDKVKKHCIQYWPNFMDKPEIFPDRLQTWHDIRENIAFNIRPYDHWAQWERKVEQEKNVYDCDFKSFLFDPAKEMSRILDFLGIKHSNRFTEWLKVHDKWLENIAHYINFIDDIDEIIYNIVNKQDMEISKYKMTVLKEGVLLHFLMFKHDLNLKTRVETLPGNTKDISYLLGKNDRTGIQKLYD